MQDLPIGMSEFSELRKRNYLYIDKTKDVYSLLRKNRRTFLSRPRRFGKSLLVSTLEEALLGNKELFKGTWIEKSDYDWISYGVIRLDFSILDSKTPEILKNSFIKILLKIATKYGLEISPNFIGVKDALETVVSSLHAKFGRVALLIDEYDYPILHTLHTPKLAMEIREVIKDFSSAIKAQQKEIEFVFVTGVSAFTKSGLSSGLNNLKNLTLDAEFSTICGYTEKEVELYFKEHLSNWAEKEKISPQDLQKELKTWYNGYCFEENSLSVYSPFSFTCAMDVQKILNFWFESATPQFLLDELNKAERRKECNFLNLEGFQATSSLLQTFEVESIPLTALLFQMGYLTINQYDSESKMYSLKYPNLEVKTALHKHLLIALTEIEASPFDSLIAKLFSALREEDMDRLIDCFKTIFYKIPYQLYQSEEKFYHAILQSLFVAADIKAQSEYSSSLGRSDIILDLAKIIYVIEIKVNKPPEEALNQIETQKYYEPFLQEGKPIRVLGLSFIRKKVKKGASEFSITYVSKRI